MNANCVLPIIVFAGASLPLTVQAAPDGELLDLINAYRADPPSCEGVPKGPLPPLESNSALARMELGAGRQLKEVLRAAGFLAARAEVITLSGPSDAGAAMRFAAQLNCRLLLSRRYSVAGVSRQGREWQILLAQPLLGPDIGDWQEAGRQVLKLVNSERAKGRACGSAYYEAVLPLHWSAKLGAAALSHSRDMAQHNYFGHKGSNGSTVAVRARDEGYLWRRIGENVATGRAKPEQVVEGWLSSPGHCLNIMNGSFTEMGAAYAVNPKSDTVIYWTQVFGTPR
ncbi:Uncharacterized conserved protein YkwD, contains CAP (CSP/antigen 5/PR1) domain [Nitrosospira sp. Nl5]|uniref:CAP domain-containing protein n=1 Tax=Nitrosospira sp. Nl5 TaxID=200120 RepID=UPI000880A5A0|nr:CAP domain-containing protein [Nitrosospira sp. Nl5]SCX91595.1 Uncharacterized conserved protein YkwD, contains CAP (CSP/antigen 5/PR1) domain [Nitrosospira sp. Nl5]